MSRTKKPLTDTEIRKAKPKEKEYPLSDGNGLILRVKPNGSKIWLFNYYHPVTKKRTNAGLGMYPQIQLSDARAKREEYRALLAKGIDPQEEKIRIQQEYENRLKILSILLQKVTLMVSTKKKLKIQKHEKRIGKD